MRKSIIGIFTRKTLFTKGKLYSNTILGGKVEFSYLKSVIEEVKRRTGIMEFNPKSRNVWIWKDVPFSFLVNLFSTNPKEAASIRAQIISPQIPRELIRLYLAHATEQEEKELDETQPVTSLTLPVCGNQKESYLTTVYWCENFFQKSIPNTLSENGTIGELIDFLQK